MMGNQTLEDVARRLRVSRRTVSRVLLDDKHVSHAVRERVTRYLKRENIVPNVHASRLAAQRVPVLGLIFPEHFLVSMDDFVGRVIRGVLGAARSRNHQVVIHAMKALDLRDTAGLYQSKGVGGLLCAGFGPNDTKTLQSLHGAGVPVASLHYRCPGVDSFDCDNVAGGYLATKHLLSIGCRRVAFLHGDPGWDSSRERFQGYRKALSEAGLSPRPQWVGNAYYAMSAARDVVLEILQRKGDPPDALFAANDLMALGACLALRERGVRVPDQMAVIGFDNIPVGGLPLLERTLSSVAQPLEEIASTATEYVMARMEGGAGAPAVHRLFAPKLMVRESTQDGRRADF